MLDRPCKERLRKFSPIEPPSHPDDRGLASHIHNNELHEGQSAPGHQGNALDVGHQVTRVLSLTASLTWGVGRFRLHIPAW